MKNIMKNEKKLSLIDKFTIIFLFGCIIDVICGLYGFLILNAELVISGLLVAVGFVVLEAVMVVLAIVLDWEC